VRSVQVQVVRPAAAGVQMIAVQLVRATVGLLVLLLLTREQFMMLRLLSSSEVCNSQRSSSRGGGAVYAPSRLGRCARPHWHDVVAAGDFAVEHW
jgi:hypothetical protein